MNSEKGDPIFHIHLLNGITASKLERMSSILQSDRKFCHICSNDSNRLDLFQKSVASLPLQTCRYKGSDNNINNDNKLKLGDLCNEPSYRPFTVWRKRPGSAGTPEKKVECGPF